MALVVKDDVAHFSGLQLCASIHVCPVCAPRIREERAREIEDALARHLAAGGGAVFLTLTMPHDWGDSLDGLLNGLLSSWRTEIGSRGWRQDRDRFGVIGFIRSMDLMIGPNGWHPHLHILLLTARPLDDANCEALAARIWPRWERAVLRSGYRAPLRSVGLNLAAVRSAEEVASYTAKVDGMDKSWGIGRELARNDAKRGTTARHRAPFALAQDAVDTGDAGDVALWLEYVRATHGRRAIEWSRGLRDLLAAPERTDEEIAAEEVGGEVIAVMNRDEWRELWRRGLDTRLLELAETDRDAALALVVMVSGATRERAGPP